MKFFCEYCGNRIDAEIDHKCPHCGASYKKNQSFLKLQEENSQEKQINEENKQKIVNHVFKFMAISKIFSIIPLIIFVIILAVAITIFIQVGQYFKIDGVSNSQNQIEAKYNEYAETSKYKVKVTKYEVVEDKFNKLEDGYEFVKFHLIVENTSNKEIKKEDVNCVVDGIAQNNDFTSGYSNLPMFIKKGLSVKGTATFEVPKDATSYDIKYGDNVTIHVEK